MASAILFALLLALLIGVIVRLRWRLVYAALRSGNVLRLGVIKGRANPGRTNVLRVLGAENLPLFGVRRLNPDSAVASRISRERRAEAFLERILALTGARRVAGSYVLNVGKVQFQLRDRFIRRLQNPNDPNSPYEETCFYLVHNGMPKVEEIATALLHLSNNPALFDKWALQNGVAFKADGKVFDRCPLLGLR